MITRNRYIQSRGVFSANETEIKYSLMLSDEVRYLGDEVENGDDVIAN